jgi:preprotein translocase subunit SecA
LRTTEPDLSPPPTPEMQESHINPLTGENEADQPAETGGVTTTVRRTAAKQLDPDDPTTWGKVPRNAPCPCGTGKKYKHCHGKAA